jgi:hypothetical protein
MKMEGGIDDGDGGRMVKRNDEESLRKERGEKEA